MSFAYAREHGFAGNSRGRRWRASTLLLLIASVAALAITGSALLVLVRAGSYSDRSKITQAHAELTFI